MAPIKGVEFGWFGDRLVIVNHRPSPVDLGGIKSRKIISQLPSAPNWLAAHSAVYLEVS